MIEKSIVIAISTRQNLHNYIIVKERQAISFNNICKKESLKILTAKNDDNIQKKIEWLFSFRLISCLGLFCIKRACGLHFSNTHG